MQSTEGATLHRQANLSGKADSEGSTARATVWFHCLS